MPQKDYGTGELDHGEEIFRVIFPAHHDAAKIMKPGEQAFDFPAAAVATQRAAVLRDRFAAVPAVRRDQLHAQSFAQALVQRIAVVGFVADQSRGSSGRNLCWRVASTRIASFGLVLARCTAIGRPWRSAIATILLPFPRFVGPTLEPLFSPNWSWRRWTLR